MKRVVTLFMIPAALYVFGVIMGATLPTVAQPPPPLQYVAVYEPSPPTAQLVPCGPRVTLWHSYHWLQSGDRALAATFHAAGTGTLIWSAGPALNAWAALPNDGSTGTFTLVVPVAAPTLPALTGLTLTLVAAPDACPNGGLWVGDLGVAVAH